MVSIQKGKKQGRMISVKLEGLSHNLIRAQEAIEEFKKQQIKQEINPVIIEEEIK